MNAGPDVERLIADWLVEEAPARAPDRILDAAAKVIDRTKQRRFAAAWREPMTFSIARLVAILAIATVVVGGGAAWIGRSTAGIGVPTATEAPVWCRGRRQHPRRADRPSKVTGLRVTRSARRSPPVRSRSASRAPSSIRHHIVGSPCDHLDGPGGHRRPG